MAIARHKTRQRELREARALVRRVQRGDARAFELLYATYEGRIYRFCHRLTGRAETAAALVELTFARALANLPEGGLDTLDVPAYLYATARTLAFERNGEPLGFRGAAESEVSVANERLSAQERAVLALRDLERRPDDEIAAALDVDEADVPGLVGAARLHLLAELRPHGIADPCPGRLADLSAHADGMLPAERRAELETHVAVVRGLPRNAVRAARGGAALPLAAGARAARASWARASRRALGLVGLPGASGGCRRPGRAAAARPSPPWRWGDSRSSAWESRSPPRTRTATARSRLRAPTPASPQPVAQPNAPASGSRLASGVVTVRRDEASRPAAHAPPCPRGRRGGSHRRASRRRIPPSCWASAGHSRPSRRLLRAASPSAGRSCHSGHDPQAGAHDSRARSCRRSRPRTRRPPRMRPRRRSRLRRPSRRPHRRRRPRRIPAAGAVRRHERAEWTIGARLRRRLKETLCPVTPSGPRSSTRRALPTPSAASSSRSSRAPSSWPPRRAAPTPIPTSTSPTRSSARGPSRCRRTTSSARSRAARAPTPTARPTTRSRTRATARAAPR